MTQSLDFLIIGAQKAATTWLQVCIGEHPEAYLPQGETSYFEDPDYQQITWDEFLESLGDPGAARKIGIKRPNYLAKPACAARIHAHVPAAKLLIVLRNPIDRAVSAHFQKMRYGFAPVEPINRGIDKLLAGEYQTHFPRAQETLEFGYYGRHLARYLEYFPREQFHFLFQRDVRSDGGSELRRAFHFLEVDPDFVPTSLQSRPQAALYSLPRLRWQKLGNRFRYTYNRENTRLYARETGRTGKYVVRFINRVDETLLRKVFGNPRPVLSPALRNRLRDLYAEDISRLEELLSMDLSFWQ